MASFALRLFKVDCVRRKLDSDVMVMKCAED